jgi:hypothetical protein
MRLPWVLIGSAVLTFIALHLAYVAGGQKQRAFEALCETHRRALRGGIISRLPDDASRHCDPAVDCRRVCRGRRRDAMKVTAVSFPAIPDYLDAPVTFVCRAHGPMLLATLSGEPWLFRLHGKHWCSLRRATVGDLEMILAAPRMLGAA